MEMAELKQHNPGKDMIIQSLHILMSHYSVITYITESLFNIIYIIHIIKSLLQIMSH